MLQKAKKIPVKYVTVSKEVHDTIQKLNIQLNDSKMILHLLDIALSHDKIILFNASLSHDCSILSECPSLSVYEIVWLPTFTNIVQKLTKTGKL
jgi:hypothetical protein